MADNVFQLKWYCRTGVWPRGAHVRQRCGRSLNPLSSMKTMVRPSFLAFFLTPASDPSSTAESWLRPVPRRVPSVAGNSNPVAAECAMPARDRISLHIRARSAAPHATTSTGWFHIRVLVGLASNRARFAAGLRNVGAACARLVLPSSAPAVRLAGVVEPTDLPIADAPLRAEPPRTGYIPSPAAVPLPSAAAPVPQNLCELPLDFPCGHTTIKHHRMSLYYSMINNTPNRGIAFACLALSC